MARFRPILTAAILAVTSTAATGADRSVYTGSFDKVRVQGAFEVRIATGRSPTASLSGGRDAVEAVDVHLEGSTLVVRAAPGGWGERPRDDGGGPVVVTLSTPALTAASLSGAGRLAIDRMAGDRIDLALAGGGAVSVGSVQSDAANISLIGDGSIAVAGGRAGKVRLISKGAGSIDAGSLDAGDLVVQADGLGTTKAQARYTAQITNAGLGQVSVGGRPKCIVRSQSRGPVACGPVR